MDWGQLPVWPIPLLSLQVGQRGPLEAGLRDAKDVDHEGKVTLGRPFQVRVLGLEVKPADSFQLELVKRKLRQLGPRLLRELDAKRCFDGRQVDVGQLELPRLGKPRGPRPTLSRTRTFGPTANLCLVSVLGKVVCPFRNVLLLGV